jgi:hypothetical protein
VCVNINNVVLEIIIIYYLFFIYNQLSTKNVSLILNKMNILLLLLLLLLRIYFLTYTYFIIVISFKHPMCYVFPVHYFYNITSHSGACMHANTYCIIESDRFNFLQDYGK